MIADFLYAPAGLFVPLCGLVLASSIIFVFGRALYNVTFHPLSAYPGPKLWAAFQWPHLVTLSRGNQEPVLHALHEKYGPVVRVRPDALSYTDGRAWQDVYGSRPGKGQIQKPPQIFKGDKLAKLPPHMLLASDADHSRQRRLLAHAFSDQALRSQEEILTGYFDLLIEKLYEQVDGPNKGKVDMVSWYNFTTFDIIGDLAFGEPFGALAKGVYHPWISNMFYFIEMANWVTISQKYAPLRWAFKSLAKFAPELGRSRDTHLNFTTERVNRRLDIETDRRDFLYYITRHNDEKGMSHDEIVANASLLVIAGSETTATLLSGVTYQLLQNPDKMLRLQNEVRSAFKSREEITLITANQLPYLHAVIEEGLRMYPPVPSTLPRKTPPEGAIVAGEFVPGGVELGVHQISAYRDPRNFVEPYIFAPERFMPEAPKKYANEKRNAFQPFSLGPRNCLGKNLAYNEMRSILARVIFEFDMELCSESQGWSNQQIRILWQKRPLMVRLKRATQSNMLSSK